MKKKSVVSVIDYHDKHCFTKGRWVHSPGIWNIPGKYYEFFVIPPSKAAEFNHPYIPYLITDTYTNPDISIDAPLFELNYQSWADEQAEQKSWNILIINHKSYTVNINEFTLLWRKVLLHADYYKLALAYYTYYDLWESAEAKKKKSFTWASTGNGWCAKWKAADYYENISFDIEKYKKVFNDNNFYPIYGETPGDFRRLQDTRKELNIRSLKIKLEGWWYRYPSWVREVNY